MLGVRAGQWACSEIIDASHQGHSSRKLEGIAVKLAAPKRAQIVPF